MTITLTYRGPDGSQWEYVGVDQGRSGTSGGLVHPGDDEGR